MKSICAVEKSHNAKTGRVSVTYAPFQTCPESCAIGEFCYAKFGPTALHANRITKSASAQGKTQIQLAKEEAEAVRGLSGKYPLRLHVSGDCPTEECARILGEACADYKKKHGKAIWTYTHAWREIPREAWGKAISVLASCENHEEVFEAQSLGYASALVVSELPRKRFKLGDTSFVPCKEQAKEIPCIGCKMCFKENAKRVILFASHGTKKKALSNFMTGGDQ